MTQQEYENKIKELQDELEQLKAAKIEAEQPKRWKPKYGETYWVVYSNGIIGDAHWGSDSDDNWRYLTSNCFKTKEEAEEYKKQIEYTARYKNYIEEHSEPIDWNDPSTHKHLAEFNYDSNKIVVECFYSYRNQGAIYASDGQIIWDAINEIGEDNFKKYVLGVK